MAVEPHNIGNVRIYADTVTEQAMHELEVLRPFGGKWNAGDPEDEAVYTDDSYETEVTNPYIEVRASINQTTGLVGTVKRFVGADNAIASLP
jgi:hypothetical protein